MLTTPRQVFLELTPRCNLACVHCPKDYGLVSESPEVDMPLETIERLEPWLHDANSAHLNIVGEPLIATHFTHALDVCARARTPVTFNIYRQAEVDEVISRSRAIAERNSCELTLFDSSFSEDEQNRDDGDGLQVGRASDRLGCADPFFEVRIRAGQIPKAVPDCQPPPFLASAERTPKGTPG